MRFPLFGLGQFGKSPNVTAAERYNVYAEILKEEDKTKLAFYNTPGKDLFVDLGASPSRGMHTLATSSKTYSVNGDTLWEINNAGIATNRGTLSTNSGYVCMDNNGTQILIVDGTAGYIFNTTTFVFTTIGAAAFPNGCTTCAFLGGRFVVNVPNSGQLQWSDINTGLTWPALNVATAEQSPDNLLAVFVDRGQLILLGDKTTEFWAITASNDQPFALIQGAVIEWGIAAIASIVKYNNSSVWLGRNRLGQVQVVELQGYNCVPITGQEFGFTVNEFGTVENAIAFAYMVNEHPMYQITFPTPAKSYFYDQSTQCWGNATSGVAQDRDIANYGTNFLNIPRVTSYVDGKIYTLNPTTYDDAGTVVIRKIVGRHVFDEMPTSVGELWIDMRTGVATPSGAGSDPQLMLRVSRDGGNSYSNQLFTSAGLQGQYQRRATWRRLGQARSDWIFEISYADPTQFNVIGAWISVVR